MLTQVSKLFDYKFKLKGFKELTPVDFILETDNWFIKYLCSDIQLDEKKRRLFLAASSMYAPDHHDKIIIGKADVEKNGLNALLPKSDEIPVSWQKKLEMKQYFSWPLSEIDVTSLPKEEADALVKRTADEDTRRIISSDNKLRSYNEITQYRVRASGEEVGKLTDFIVNDDDWKIRYLLIDTQTWIPINRNILISPAWVRQINWSENGIDLSTKKEKIKSCPEYRPGDKISEDMEIRLFKHFGE